MKNLALTLAFALALPALADDDAQAVFKQSCAKCHGEDGKGKTEMGKKAHAPDFTRERWQQRHKDDSIVKAITDGVVEHGKKRMPAFKEKLSAEQIQSLVPYVRAFGASGGSQAEPGSGRPAEKPADGSGSAQ